MGTNPPDPVPRLDLSPLIEPEEWLHYADVVRQALAEGLPFAFGGALAMAATSPRRRSTKDVDLFVVESDRDAFLKILDAHGFQDYFDEQPYDRSWIYRGKRGCTILDIIWGLPNHRLQVDDDWVSRGPQVKVHGETIRLIPIEELIRSKIYVMQRDRCDWPDLLNVLALSAGQIDWPRMLDRIGPDRPLLGSLMAAFAWLAPDATLHVPRDVWPALGLLVPEPIVLSEDRAHLLDTRDWFGAGFTDVDLERKAC